MFTFLSFYCSAIVTVAQLYMLLQCNSRHYLMPLLAITVHQNASNPENTLVLLP